MNLLQALARQPASYRLMLRTSGLAEWSEKAVRRLTKGRIGTLDLIGLSMIQLTVAGRKTGRPRTVSLQYIADGQDLLVVGSNWARSRHPAWSSNLMAAKEVMVQRKGERFKAAVIHLTGPEREHAWRTILEAWPNYEIAESLSGGRQFRLFALTPLAR